MGKEFDLKETRNNLVAKDNRIIQESRFSLSLLENKAVLYLISKIKPDDKPNQIYVFSCREFQALLNWNKEASYQNIKIMLQNLGDMSLWIRGEVNGREKDILVRWFNIVHLDPGNGEIEISFHEDMFPYLLDLQKHLEEEKRYYTTYKLQNVSLMKHKYSIKLYELLKSYQYNNQKWTFENGTGSEFDLQIRLADTKMDRKTRRAVSMIPDGWANWAVFKRNVLDPAVQEINKYTDIKVAYEGKKVDLHHRKSRAIRTIEFYMVGKTAPEQKSTDQIIDAEYTIMESHHPSVEELFFEEHEKSIAAERKEKEYFDALKKEQCINASEHPMLYESLVEERKADFDEKKVNELYNTAIRGRVAGNIPRDQWEIFATDLITYYYDRAEATPEETKSTTYNRILDCVKNDYEQVVKDLLEKYRVYS